MISSWSRLSGIVLACVLAGSHLAAARQAQSSTPLHFEVATIKPSQALSGATGDCYNPGVDLTNGAKDNLIPRGRCLIHSATLRHLINYAYHIPATRLSGGPVWADEIRFDVDAKAEDAAATHAELSTMLQTLLADRFKLKFHRETKDIPGYALVVTSNGAKLQASTGADDISSIKVQVARGSKRSESPEGCLRLVAQKVPADYFFIESAEKPSEN